jgi:hypothetical protein
MRHSAQLLTLESQGPSRESDHCSAVGTDRPARPHTTARPAEGRLHSRRPAPAGRRTTPPGESGGRPVEVGAADAAAAVGAAGAGQPRCGPAGRPGPRRGLGIIPGSAARRRGRGWPRRRRLGGRWSRAARAWGRPPAASLRVRFPLIMATKPWERPPGEKCPSLGEEIGKGVNQKEHFSQEYTSRNTHKRIHIKETTRPRWTRLGAGGPQATPGQRPPS